MQASRPRSRWRWLARVAGLLVVLVLGAVVVTAARGVYDLSPFPRDPASAPSWTRPCFQATSQYDHEPQCARVRGRVVWREISDPDGDGDRHIVVLSRMRLRVVKLLAGQALPGVGAEVEAVGFTTVGASGEREIVAEALWH
jgi:hypothetical protein